MFESTEITEKRSTASRDDAKATALEFNLGDSRLGLGALNVMAASVGVWGSICLVSGLGNCNSIQELTRGIIFALTGM